MRARAGLVVLALTLGTLLPARAVGPEVLFGGAITPIATIDLPGAVSGRITEVGGTRYLVAHEPEGISVFDITVPEAPLLRNHLPLPHYYTEDMDFGGDVLLVALDPSWVDVTGQYGTVGGIFVVDISQLPLLTLHYVNPLTANRWTEPASATHGGGHTISCVRKDCSWAYVNGSSTIGVLDLRNPAAPKVASTFPSPVGSTHDIQVDGVGIAWLVGSGGMVGLDTTKVLKPKSVTPVMSGYGDGQLGYHHNSLRPDAAKWKPRTSGYGDPKVKKGELLLVTEEAVWPVLEQQLCDGQGRFQTRWLRDGDALGKGGPATIDVLDTWETELQVGGEAGLGVVWCSAHYFDYRNGLVAIAWYEQGTRLLDVSDPRHIEQVGYFVPPGGEVWSTLWAGPGAVLPGDILYAFDWTRGIDILRVDTSAPLIPVRAPVPAEWLDRAPARIERRGHPTWGLGCAIPTAR